jgi:hypothetical protein
VVGNVIIFMVGMMVVGVGKKKGKDQWEEKLMVNTMDDKKMVGGNRFDVAVDCC